MKIEYNVPIGSRKREDSQAFENFMSDAKQKTMCITYDTIEDAIRRRVSLQKIVEQEDWWKSVIIKRRLEKIYFIKLQGGKS